SDIFSTGVVLWEILTGRRLFKKKSNPETIEAVQSMTIFPPSAYRNEIPSDLDDIVMKALERDPEARYASAEDMSLALTKFLLRHHPEFKPVQVGDFLKEVFDNEENTGDLYQEKTMREELTVREIGEMPREGNEEEAIELPEDTMIVDPQELDFRSIFEEIDVDEEVSDITRAIGFSEVSTSGTAEVDPSLLPDAKPKPPPEPEEITGDLEIDGEVEAPEPKFTPIPSKRKPAASASTSAEAGSAAPARERWVLPLMLLLFLAGLGLLRYFMTRSEKKAPTPAPIQASARSSLEVRSQPAGAAIYIDGQPIGQKTPAILNLQNLKFPLVLGLSLGGPPSWQRRLEEAAPGLIVADLQIPVGFLEVQSSPSGASISLDGKNAGKTPLLAHQVPANQEIDLSLELQGFKTYQNEISLAPGQNLRIYHAMEKNSSR
ncbi:MAG TPA: PEGA domain-containing protein, partial [bacterium]|nr:PEGA domain-containing protein [bacterium]